MNLANLFYLKEKLLSDLKKEIRPEEFPDHEAYLNHLNAMEEGVMSFYAEATHHMLETMTEEKLKKSA